MIIANINDEVNKIGLNIRINENVVSINNKQFLDILLNELEIKDYKLTKCERFDLITTLLIINNEGLNYEKIIEILEISKSTFYLELDEFRNFLLNYKFDLLNIHSIGLTIQSNEYYINRFILNILNKKIYLLQILFNSNNYTISVSNNYINLKTRVSKLVNVFENSKDVNLFDQSNLVLTYYLMIFYYRSNKNQLDNSASNIKLSYDMKILLPLIKKYLGIDLPKEKIDFFEELISNMKYKSNVVKSSKSPSIQIITRKFIDKISLELQVPFHKDYQLFENLSNHILRIYSYHTDVEDEAPDLSLFTIENIHIDSSVRKNLYLLNNFFSRELTNNEISYILIYFYGSYEKIKQSVINNIKIAIICNSGIGTSQLLKLKLKQKFNFQILGVFNKREIMDLDLNQCDLIISTVVLDHIHFPSLYVNSVLSSNDINLIEAKINKISYKKINYYFNQPILKEDILLRNNKSKSLKEYLTVDYIKVTDDVKSWEEAIKIAGDLLIKNNVVDKGYVINCIKNIKEKGPYIIIADRTALPHADISNEIMAIGFSLLIIRNPIFFDNNTKEKINFIIMFATLDYKSHLSALFDITILFSDDNFKNELLKANNSVEAYEIIRKNLNYKLKKEN